MKRGHERPEEARRQLAVPRQRRAQQAGEDLQKTTLCVPSIPLNTAYDTGSTAIQLPASASLPSCLPGRTQRVSC